MTAGHKIPKNITPFLSAQDINKQSKPIRVLNKQLKETNTKRSAVPCDVPLLFGIYTSYAMLSSGIPWTDRWEGSVEYRRIHNGFPVF